MRFSNKTAKMVMVSGAVIALAGCGTDTASSSSSSGPPSIPDEWVQIMDDQLNAADRVGSVPVIDRDAGCELFDPPEVGDGTPEPRGSGVSTFGSDGERYICQFGSPPITFVIGRTESAESLADTTLSVDDEDVTEHEVAGTRFVVLDHTYPNGRVEQTAQLVDEQRNVFVSAEIETKPGNQLPDDWDTADTAGVLADILRS
ncbi:hypothetical protein EV191_1011208 [Tamaricihabitans halophyticus]|uniref:DUF3558 domain-containing protein n=1 Tax=Tamaricihabitans halophyticus TaxID=1262583 RepID=A0A4R2RCV8_9PSEU|nr:hypothetical protein [Tamaricihabitans halophyticus]TCP57255.1 hypothetical protein EV191_1011208 [Tamaricihabitans halophyticus]